MKKQITSKVLGVLLQKENFESWWESELIEIPFLNKSRLSITYLDYEPEYDKTFIDEADQAIVNFLKLNIEDRNRVSQLAYNNCMDFLNEVGFDYVDESLTELTDINNIWNYIYPTGIYISRRPYRDNDVYVQVACECEWEQEHGLQFVFRQGRKLTRISEQDGHLTEADAFGKPDEEDELLSKF